MPSDVGDFIEGKLSRRPLCWNGREAAVGSAGMWHGDLVGCVSLDFRPSGLMPPTRGFGQIAERSHGRRWMTCPKQSASAKRNRDSICIAAHFGSMALHRIRLFAFAWSAQGRLWSRRDGCRWAFGGRGLVELLAASGGPRRASNARGVRAGQRVRDDAAWRKSRAVHTRLVTAWSIASRFVAPIPRARRDNPRPQWRPLARQAARRSGGAVRLLEIERGAVAERCVCRWSVVCFSAATPRRG